jgi:hypothetical protein
MVHPTITAQQIEKAQKRRHQQRVALLCQIVDEFCPPPAPDQQRGVGRPVSFSDNLILKMEMLGRLSGITGETVLLRHLERHYSDLFAHLPTQSWLWRRLRRLMPKLEAFRRYLTRRLGVDLEDIRIIDTLPMPVFKTARPGRGNGFDLISWGYCAAKKLHYCGFKLMLSITPSGLPDFYDMCSAHYHDINALEELVSTLLDALALGDKGFLDQDRQQRLLARQGVYVLTYQRVNQQRHNTPLEKWILDKYRQRIETTNSQLVDLMHIDNLGAKTDLGWAKRLMGAMTAFTLGIYLNFLLGRDLLAVKALFA